MNLFKGTAIFACITTLLCVVFIICSYCFGTIHELNNIIDETSQIQEENESIIDDTYDDEISDVKGCEILNRELGSLFAFFVGLIFNIIKYFLIIVPLGTLFLTMFNNGLAYIINCGVKKKWKLVCGYVLFGISIFIMVTSVGIDIYTIVTMATLRNFSLKQIQFGIILAFIYMVGIVGQSLALYIDNKRNNYSVMG